MNKPTFAPWPSFDQEIIKAVSDILRSGKVSQWTGPNVYAFEKESAKYLGAKHAIAMTNGSVTMDVALRILGVGSGDEVIVTCRSFVASASCVALTGALPVFADVDPMTGNVTAETISRVVTKKTKAVIAVHLAGWPCDMDPILRLCRSKKLFLIEDCAQANGAKYKGKDVGTFGDFGSFSFCQDKIFTTAGEGGMLVTDNTIFWKKAWSLKDHGRDFDIVFNRKSGTGFVWMVNSFGTNHRMNEVQATIGRIFLKRLDDMVRRRRKYAAMLDDAFEKMESLVVTHPPKGIEPAYYKYYVQVNPKKLRKGLTRDGVLLKLAALGVPCGCGACPEIYREKAFQHQRKELGLASQKRLPAARQLGERCIMLQVHPTLSKECIEYTIWAMKKVLG